MTDAELQRMRTTIAITNGLPRPDATALLDEVRRLRAALAAIRDMAEDDLRKALTYSPSLHQIEADARAALAPPPSKESRA